MDGAWRDKKGFYFLKNRQYGKLCTYGLIFAKVSAGILPLVEMLLTARFIDAVSGVFVSHEVGADIFLLVILWILVIGVTWVVNESVQFILCRLTQRVREGVRAELTRKTACLPYYLVENQRVQDQIGRLAKNPEKEIVDGLYIMLSIAVIGVRVLGIGGIVSARVWWCGLFLFLLFLPLVYLAKKNGENMYQVGKEVSGHMRRYGYYDELLNSREDVLERNLFSFTGFLQGKWSREYDLASRLYMKSFLKYFFAARGYGLAAAMISVFMILALLLPLGSGEISVGIFVSAASQLLNVVSIMVQQLSELLKQLSGNREFRKDLVDFMGLPEEGEDILEAPDNAFAGFGELVFEHVSFCYPGTEKYVLRDVCFRLEAGKHYAFTGANAAGKSTVIKLMTGLYDSYEGRILVNGRELREYSPQEKKSLYAVVFQDFARYQISVREMVGLGIPGHGEDGLSGKMSGYGAARESQGAAFGQSTLRKRRKVRLALEQVGLSEFVDGLADGIDTTLGKFEQDNGEASGGQWQKLALARAFVSDAPICILDEPSASLDPVSESRLYQEYGKLSQGRTTVFISHRLGSVRLADLIFVFGEGRVLEQGTFEELMGYESKFREMYEVQRSWYEEAS